MQLEDDVMAKKGFVTQVKKFALSQSASKSEWFLLDFCQLGFIGMFKAELLSLKLSSKDRSMANIHGNIEGE